MLTIYESRLTTEYQIDSVGVLNANHIRNQTQLHSLHALNPNHIRKQTLLTMDTGEWRSIYEVKLILKKN